MAWATVAEANTVWVQIGTKKNKKGEDKPVLVRTGIRVRMLDGSWWFNCFRSKTWTCHWMGQEIQGKGFNAKSVSVEKKQSFTPNALAREYTGPRKRLIAALDSGVTLAWADEAMKRAAA